MEKGAQPVIIIKKKKRRGHEHHGGSWKVALADFMTAMMAFFLLMWLLESTTPAEQEAIANYFQDPGSEWLIGPGGADSGVIDLKPKPTATDVIDLNPTPKASELEQPLPSDNILSEEALHKQLEQAEQEQLEALKAKIEAEINSADSVFGELKDQILIDFTGLGLRIQIVDKEQRPMFDVGSAQLKSYSQDLLHTLAPIIDKVPNKISMNGHTDSIPYGAGATYTNWELSADRANSARRALLEGAYPEEKVITVQGMGSVAPLLVDKPTAPINRRIAIIVLKKTVSDALVNADSGLKSTDLDSTPLTGVPQTEQSSSELEATERAMTEAEVERAIDTLLEKEE